MTTTDRTPNLVEMTVKTRLTARRLFLALITVMTAILGMHQPALAAAGDYTISNCAVPGTSGNTDTGPWAAYGGTPGSSGFDLSCSPSGADTFGVFGSRLNADSSAGVVLSTAGTPITIRHLDAWWRALPSSSGSDTFAVVYQHAALASPVHATEYDVRATGTSTPFASNTRQVTVQVNCSTNASDHCFFVNPLSPILQILGTKVTLHEEVLPDIEVTGGSLVAGGAVSGTRAVSYQAEDGESGVEKVLVRLGGKVVGAHDFSTSASCPRTNLAACSTSRSGTIDVDTTQVADGAHDASLVAVDAAGNTTTRPVAGQVVVQNARPGGPLPGGSLPGGSLPVSPLPGGGGGPWAAPVPGGPRVANGDNASVKAKLVVRTSRSGRSVKVGFGRRTAITGTLKDEAGRPVRRATLVVLARTRMAGARARVVGTVRTDAGGRFRYLAPAGASRELTFAYRAWSTDRDYASTQQVTVLVAAAATLRATPRTLRNGQRVRFRGTVGGLPMPKSGVLVDLQVRVGTRWQTFLKGSLRTDRRGRFAASYRFRRTTVSQSYRFRAVVRRDSSFPFTERASRSVAVRVRA